MLAYAAVAQLALDQFPGALPFTAQSSRFSAAGTVLIIDTISGTTYGTTPIVGLPFALVIGFGGYITGNIALQFVAPSGAVQNANPGFVFISPQAISGLDRFNPGQSIVYRAAVGEFQETGLWQVVVLQGTGILKVLFFTIAGRH